MDTTAYGGLSTILGSVDDYKTWSIQAVLQTRANVQECLAIIYYLQISLEDAEQDKNLWNECPFIELLCITYRNLGQV